MNCPKCFHRLSRITESEFQESLTRVYRRRQCVQCDHKFTTYELYLEEANAAHNVKVSANLLTDAIKLLEAVRLGEKQQKSVENAAPEYNAPDDRADFFAYRQDGIQQMLRAAGEIASNGTDEEDDGFDPDRIDPELGW